jgi:hypothetical protein
MRALAALAAWAVLALAQGAPAGAPLEQRELHDKAKLHHWFATWAKSHSWVKKGTGESTRQVVSWEIFSGPDCHEKNAAMVQVTHSEWNRLRHVYPFMRPVNHGMTLFPVETCVDIVARSSYFVHPRPLPKYPRMLFPPDQRLIGWKPHVFSCDSAGELSQVAWPEGSGCKGDPISTPVHSDNTPHLANASVAEQEAGGKIVRMRTANTCGYQKELNMSYRLQCVSTAFPLIPP